MIRGTFADLFHRITGISEVQLGQQQGYNALQNAQQQQGQLQGLLGQLGAMGGQGVQGIQNNNPFINAQDPIYPGKVVYPDGAQRFGFVKTPHVEEIAKEFGFEFSWDSDSYKHKNGGYVSRRSIEESGIPLRELFSRQKTPNITWLEDRVNEIRVKL